jgi:hypothetical protein
MPSIRRLARALTWGAVIVASFTGCCLFCDDTRYNAQRTEVKSWSVSSAPRIFVDLFDGDISIVQGANDVVRGVFLSLATTKRSQSASVTALDAIQISTTQEGDSIRITTRSDAAVQAHLSTNLELRVPKGARLELLTADGHIFIGQYWGGPNGAYLTKSPVVLGSVKAKALGGIGDAQIDVDIATPAPRLEALPRAIALDLECRHGSIAIKGDNLLVNARAPGETIITTTEEDEGPGTYETEAAGSITFSGTLAEGFHSLQASSHITVRVPRDASFRVDASTADGIVTSDFPVREEGERIPTRLFGSVGDSPKVFLRLRNRGGPIRIENVPDRHP